MAPDHHLGYRCGPFPHLPSDPLNDRIFDASIFHHWTAAYCLCLLHRTGTRPRRWPYLDLNLSVVNMRQYRRRLHHGSRFSAAISKASIATSHAVVSCTDLGSVKICRLASSSVRSVLPSGKTTGRSRRLSQDTTRLSNKNRRIQNWGGIFVPLCRCGFMSGTRLR